MRKVAVTIASLALIAPLALVASAEAGQYKTLNERRLTGSSLGVGDVPRWMQRREKPTMEREYNASPTAGPDVCLDADGNDVTGPVPAQSMASTVTTRQNLDDFSFYEINSNIYQYASRGKAEKAWRQIEDTIWGCNGTIVVEVEEELDGEPVTVDITVNTEVTQAQQLFGTPGYALFFNVDLSLYAADLEIDLIGDQYAVYRLAGTSIIRVEYAKVNASSPLSIGRNSRLFVNAMANVVAQRVQNRSTR